MENLFVTVDTTKKLINAGVKSESLFSWFPLIGYAEEVITDTDDNEDDFAFKEFVVLSSNASKYYISNTMLELWRPGILPALTSSEVGLLMPASVLIDEKECFLAIEKVDDIWCNYYINLEEDEVMTGMFTHKNEAEARALLLLELLEYKTINVKQINKQ